MNSKGFRCIWSDERDNVFDDFALLDRQFFEVKSNLSYKFIILKYFFNPINIDIDCNEPSIWKDIAT